MKAKATKTPASKNRSVYVSCREEPDFLLIIMFMFLFVNLANNSSEGEAKPETGEGNVKLKLFSKRVSESERAQSQGWRM